MDALTGALVAAAVAWGSILLARVLPLERALGADGMRRVAGASVAVAALVVLGVPLPAWGPWALLAAALVVAAGAHAVTSRRKEQALNRGDA